MAAGLTALLLSTLVLVGGGSAGATTVVHIVKAPSGACLNPRVASTITPGAWKGGAPFHFAHQSWRIASGTSSAYMNVVPCTSSHAVEVFAVKQLWSSVSQIPSPGTAAYNRLVSTVVLPFCQSRAAQFLGLPSTIDSPWTAYLPSRAQAKALGSLGVRCAFTYEGQNSDGSSTMHSLGNATWKRTQDQFFAVKPVKPRIASASLTCAAAAGGGYTVTRRLRFAADQRWIVPARVDTDGVWFIDSTGLERPVGITGKTAFPAQTLSTKTLIATQTWKVPDGTISIKAPATVVTNWTTALDQRATYWLTTTATSISTTACAPLV